VALPPHSKVLRTKRAPHFVKNSQRASLTLRSNAHEDRSTGEVIAHPRKRAAYFVVGAVLGGILGYGIITAGPGPAPSIFAARREVVGVRRRTHVGRPIRAVASRLLAAKSLSLAALG
jgi:hypothetical protein